jgi:uroporphyrinogen decarboxylase
MSTRMEAFRKTMALEEVAWVPVMPTITGWAAKRSGVPFPKLIYDVETMTRAQAEAQRLTGIDAIFGYFDALVIPQAFGCGLNFASAPPAAEPIALHGIADVEALRAPDVRREFRFPLTLEMVHRLAELPGRDAPVVIGMEGPFTTSARIYGVTNLLRATLKNRPLVEKLLEKVGAAVIDFARTAAEFGAECLFLPDPVSSSTMISPKMYREFALPWVQRVVEALPIPVILHICGHTEPILDLMAETGAKVLSLDQCMDLGKAKQTVAGRCGLGGNLSPRDVLLRGKPEDVRRETLKCLAQVGRKGYVLMAGCAVIADTPLENLRAMVETAREA